jgi:hypothetical protein
MKWIKKGLIYCPDGSMPWAKHSALQPTPLLREDGSIRVFAGFRDDNGVGRIGYVDLSANNPSEVIKVSPHPVLDVGLPGTFDDNGVIPCAIIARDEKLFLYYAGYELSQKVRFKGFSGLAVSVDGGETFTRYQNTPILDRTNSEFLFRAIHSIMFDDGVWKAWYGAGSEFVQGKTKTLPIYNIRYMESTDGVNFPTSGKLCLDTNEKEYRVGRPFVIKTDSIYRMFFGFSTETIPYKLSYAESIDGLNWTRKDSEMQFDSNSITDFDSEMSCYPSIVMYNKKIYMFYNGNDYGKKGFGYAQLDGDFK